MRTRSESQYLRTVIFFIFRDTRSRLIFFIVFLRLLKLTERFGITFEQTDGNNEKHKNYLSNYEAAVFIALKRFQLE